MIHFRRLTKLFLNVSDHSSMKLSQNLEFIVEKILKSW